MKKKSKGPIKRLFKRESENNSSSFRAFSDLYHVKKDFPKEENIQEILLQKKAEENLKTNFSEDQWKENVMVYEDQEEYVLKAPSKKENFPIPLLEETYLPICYDELLKDGKPLPLTDEPFCRDGLREGADRRLIDRLRCGDFPPQQTLDLHHKTLDEAFDLLEKNFHRAWHEGMRCFLIIHGMGGKQGKIWQKIPSWFLESRLGGFVLAFCEASVFFGGEGATLVFLRKNNHHSKKY